MTKGAHILLVDDDEESRGIYAEFLREANFEVTEAEDGLDALSKANEKCPDLVFTGIIMPKMDGFSLVEELKKNVITAHVPVVFLSHLGRKEDEERSREIGVKDFIVRDTTTPREVMSRLKAQLSATEYMVSIDPRSYDAQKFARDFGIHPDFEGLSANQKYVLRLKLKDSQAKRFDADLLSA